MFPLTLAKIPDVLKAEVPRDLGFEIAPQTPVTGAAIDSRSVRPGDLFFALPGDRTDGHAHAADALRRGAAAVVLTRDTGDRQVLIVHDPAAALARLGAWNRARFGGPVVAVGGSHGKTTCRELIRAALAPLGPGVASRANFNNHLGVPLTLCELEPRHEFAVAEVAASRPGEIAALCQSVRPTGVVLTGVGHAHVGTFGGVAALRAAKRELLDAVPAGGFAVVNGDDPGARDLARGAPCRVILAGTADGCDVRVCPLPSPPDRLRFRFDRGMMTVHTPGAHLLPYAASALAVARELGLPPDCIAPALNAFRPQEGRNRLEQVGGVAVIDDAYNASPEAFAAAVRTLAEYPLPPGGRRWLVAGGMRELGAEADRLHAEVGAAIAAAGFERVLFVGDRGGTLADAAGVGERVPGAQAAVAAVLADLRAGDVILVKGCRADRLERVVAGVLSGLRGRAEKSG